MNSIPLWRRWWYLDWRPSSGDIHRGMCFIYFLNSGAGEGGCLSGEWEERYWSLWNIQQNSNHSPGQSKGRWTSEKPRLENKRGEIQRDPILSFFLEEKTDKRTEVPNRFLSNPSMAFSSGIKVHCCSWFRTVWKRSTEGNKCEKMVL